MGLSYGCQPWLKPFFTVIPQPDAMVEILSGPLKISRFQKSHGDDAC